LVYKYILIGCYEDGIDYPGGEIAETISNSSDECQKECQSNEQCNYWTWIKPESAQVANHCYLKPRVINRTPTSLQSNGKETISGPRYCHGR
jgi:hypothetical protein